MSDNPDYEHIRGLGAVQYDPSSEPGRFTTTTITLDTHQTRSEQIDVDLEVEQRLNGSYQKVGVEEGRIRCVTSVCWEQRTRSGALAAPLVP